MRPIVATVGPNAGAGTPSSWIRLDDWSDSEVSLQVNVTGTVNYTVQQTLDDPNSPTNPVASGSVIWYSHPDPALVGATANAQGNYAFKPVFVRLMMNSGNGTASLTVVQAGGGNY